MGVAGDGVVGEAATGLTTAVHWRRHARGQAAAAAERRAAAASKSRGKPARASEAKPLLDDKKGPNYMSAQTYN